MNLASETQSLIAGALYDFLGHLTAEERSFKVGAEDPVYDVMEVFARWARSRNLNIEDAEVEGWQDRKVATNIRELMAEDSTSKRVVGALTDFAAYCAKEETNREGQLFSWASLRELSLANPQHRWNADWWA